MTKVEVAAGVLSSDSKGVSERDLSELPALRKRTDGFLSLDISEWSDEAEALFGNEFHCHPMAISESGALLKVLTADQSGSSTQARTFSPGHAKDPRDPLLAAINFTAKPWRCL